MFRAQALQGWRPGVKSSFDIGQIDFAEKPVHHIVVDCDIVMILHGKGNTVLGRFLAGKLQSFNNDSILSVKRYAGTFVTGEYSHHIGPQITG